jgi:hypothetical protein
MALHHHFSILYYDQQQNPHSIRVITIRHNNPSFHPAPGIFRFRTFCLRVGTADLVPGRSLVMSLFLFCPPG